MCFGSQQPRFKTEETQSEFAENNFEMSGFFKEKQDRKAEELELRKQILETHQHSCFASESKRFKGEQVQVKAGVGDYELNQNDIN